MMKARNRGLLTIIISPLQSLMNDQVQQLQANGYNHAASLNSSLTMPERHRVLEGIGMGDIHLLYIAPEQLRNSSFISAIKSREIGQCISHACLNEETICRYARKIVIQEIRSRLKKAW